MLVPLTALFGVVALIALHATVGVARIACPCLVYLISRVCIALCDSITSLSPLSSVVAFASPAAIGAR